MSKPGMSSTPPAATAPAEASETASAETTEATPVKASEIASVKVSKTAVLLRRLIPLSAPILKTLSQRLPHASRKAPCGAR